MLNLLSHFISDIKTTHGKIRYEHETIRYEHGTIRYKHIQMSQRREASMLNLQSQFMSLKISKRLSHETIRYENIQMSLRREASLLNLKILCIKTGIVPSLVTIA